MPSLTDIPILLRTNPDKNAFMQWILSLPIGRNVRAATARIYSKDTNIVFTNEDWRILTAFNPKGTPPRAPQIPPPSRQ